MTKATKTDAEQPMYEKFTKHARNVIRLAEAAAEKANHQYIGTEHILVGLLNDGSGLVNRVLERSGIDVHAIVRAAEEIIQPIPPENRHKSLPYSPFAKEVLTFAIREGMQDNYVGIKHLLLAMVWFNNGTAAPVIEQFGLTQQVIREVAGQSNRRDE